VLHERVTPVAPAPSPLGPPLDLVLHIGTGKTGTSSIQVFMHRNREGLADRGVLYPRSPGRTRHVRLSLSVRADETLSDLPGWRRLGLTSPQDFRRKFHRRLFREIDNSGLAQVVFSDEGLYALPDEAMRNLTRLVEQRAGRLRVVAYLRRQDDHLVSHYQQWVKRGETERLVDRVQQGAYSRIHDYAARLRPWRHLIEPTELVVRRFERDSFVDGSLHQDFLDAAHIDVRADDFEQVEPRNESLDADAVEFLRIVNVLRQADPSLLGVDNHAMIRPLASVSDGPVLTAPDSVLDEYMSQWEESNRAVAREFLGDESGQLFRSPRRTRHTTTEQRLDPARIDTFVSLLELPAQVHAPLRRLAEREAGAPAPG
jgi:hypothetical protein